MNDPEAKRTGTKAFNANDLKQLLEGEVTLVERALALPNPELVGFWRELDGFILQGEHVVRVLSALRSGAITREQANRWGSFIYLDGGQWLPLETPDWVRTKEDVARFANELADKEADVKRPEPIEIPYQIELEEQIVEAIAMLDSVADVEFSGENVDEELDRLIADLRRT